MKALSSMEALWLRRFQSADDGSPRLVCFPHAGGSASFFLPVARALAPAVDVLAVQYPGRQDRRAEAGIDEIHTLADHVTDALSGCLDEKMTLFGHSMGAIVAFEVARRLHRICPVQPVHLFVSGRGAPSRYRKDTVHLRDDAGIVAEVRALGGTDPQMLDDADLRELIMPALRQDYRAIETYRHVPDKPLSCPVTVLMGDQDPYTTVDDARAWQMHAPESGFDLKIFRGGHFFLASRAVEVLDVLSRHLTPAARVAR